ncbi:hypothetical protein [Nannocystis exedens]|uniref:hypothetical protein n=1 Tax=Nannocystis exedens TaxID=54 RepID=UPI001475A722|nr:hypothetical protein [Nannocystis exedens]
MVARRVVWVSVLLLSSACGEAGTGSGGDTATAGTTTGATTTATTSTNPTTSTSATPTSGGSATETGTSAPTSTSEATTAVTGTGDPPTSTGVTTTSEPGTTTSGSSTTSTSEPGTTGEPSTTRSGSTTTTTGAVDEPPPPPEMLAGCQSCACCDPWWISWDEVPGATHYVVRWKCSVNPEQVHDVGAVTMIADVCNDLDMCNGMCAFTVGYIRVEACDEDGCSPPVDIPAPGVPITCGGGCCC